MRHIVLVTIAITVHIPLITFAKAFHTAHDTYCDCFI